MAGSVLMAGDSPVAAALEAHLRQMMPKADPRRAVLPPVAGAALDALAEGGVAVTQGVVAQLAATRARLSPAAAHGPVGHRQQDQQSREPGPQKQPEQRRAPPAERARGRDALGAHGRRGTAGRRFAAG